MEPLFQSERKHRRTRDAPVPRGRGGHDEAVGAARLTAELDGAAARRPEALGSRDSVLRRDRIVRRSLITVDVASVALALVLTGLPQLDEREGVALVIALPLIVGLSRLMGLYDRDELVLNHSTLDEAPGLFQLSALYALVLYVIDHLVLPGSLVRTPGALVVLWSALFALLVVSRSAVRTGIRRASEPERCLLIADSQTRARLVDKLASRHRAPARLVNFLALPDEVDPAIPGLARLPGGADGLERLREEIERDDIQRVIVAPGEARQEVVLRAITQAKVLGVKVSILPRMFEVVGSAVEFDFFDGLTLLGVRRFGLSRSSRLIKRALDLVGASVALLLFAPLMVALAVAVRLDSPGPALFRQTRVGRDGRLFELLKFRSMVLGADELKDALRDRNEADGLFKISDDPRITPVGRFIRRTSLDELPQLFNVLRGEMSLVGPRPLVIEDDQRVEGWHRRRLHLTPGMTGQWQVLGSARIPLSEMVTIDYLYVATWSLWGDIKILLRTMHYVLARRGM